MQKKTRFVKSSPGRVEGSVSSYSSSRKRRQDGNTDLMVRTTSAAEGSLRLPA